MGKALVVLLRASGSGALTRREGQAVLEPSVCIGWKSLLWPAALATNSASGALPARPAQVALHLCNALATGGLQQGSERAAARMARGPNARLIDSAGPQHFETFLSLPGRRRALTKHRSNASLWLAMFGTWLWYHTINSTAVWLPAAGRKGER